MTLAFLSGGELHAQSSILHSGPWYKLAVEKDGVYKIDFNLLKKMGLDPASVDPRGIRIYGNEGGMLPQENDTARPEDLMENAIAVIGEDDGVFNDSDYILFFGYGPDRAYYDLSSNSIYYQHNLYSDQNFYFLTVSDDFGKRIGATENIGGSFPTISAFNDFVYHETNTYNELHSGREWFGEKFSPNQSVTFNLTMEGIVNGSSAMIVSDVMAKSTGGSAFTIDFNGTTISEQSVPPISGGQYTAKGHQVRDSITFSAVSGASQTISYQYTSAGTGSTGYLNYFLLNYERHLSRYGNQTIFQSARSTTHEVSSFQISNAAGTTIWDITEPYETRNQAFSLSNGTAAFSAATSSLRKFIIFNSNIPAPAFIGGINNQNLHGTPATDMIIVTHPTLLTEAQRLADHRSRHSGWTVQVVTPEEIFNEFSSGRQDVTAIRDYAKHLNDRYPGTLKALLLFGRSSYDYKNRVTNNSNLVPTYESYNSLHPLQTYSSDDYFGFLEDDEGAWPEAGSSDDHTLDIGVGRLPVKTIEEATAVVDKIIGYETNRQSMGRWRKRIVFVADDGSLSDNFTSLHQAQANDLSVTTEGTNPETDSRKIFLGTYKKKIQPNGETVPQATQNILENFDNGALIINYTGHGSEKIWADEQVFTDFDIAELDNKLYPFLVTATCEFGRHDDPNNISSAEMVLKKEKSGSIGLITSARPVNSGTNYDLNSAFYNALFARDSANGKLPILGEVFRNTKNNSMNDVANRNFSLMADPSLTLALPAFTIHTEEIKTATGSDTLKALSTVTVKGKVMDFHGNMLHDFNGILEASLFDKQTEAVTIGKNNPPFTFQQWSNTIFRGKATVKAGEFEFNFIVPKNIAYQTGSGKLSVYASDTVTFRDAGGAGDFKIGGTESEISSDDTPPGIKLYMGDTTFVNGGMTGVNTTLVAHISDLSGINVSNYGIGNTMTAILDNDQYWFVDEYYEAALDDFTNGWLHFPMKGLAPGTHSITLKVWDTHNNPAEATVDFIVTDGEALIIERVGNYPNPFSESTTVFFTHNSSGDDLEAVVQVYDLRGELLHTIEKTIYASPYRVDLTGLNVAQENGKKLMNGLYLARIIVRSLTNNSKNEAVAKLIVVN